MMVIVVKAESELVLIFLQIMFTTIDRWCEREDISINIRKMVLVPFTSKRKLKNLEPPSINYVIIPFAS